jgi:hypothetical protein
VPPQDVDEDVGIGEDAGTAGADDNPLSGEGIGWHGLDVAPPEAEALGGVFNGHRIYFV